MDLEIVILAAGKGTRLHSCVPKVLYKLAGKTLLDHVIDCAKQVPNVANIHIVGGDGIDQLRQSVTHDNIRWVQQKEILGTGHALLQAINLFTPDKRVLVLYGDVPLIKVETLNNLLKTLEQGGLAILTSHMDNPTGYGRIIRKNNNVTANNVTANNVAANNVAAIVEHKDASVEELNIKEINTGIMTSYAKNFQKWLPQLKNNNQQKEYYLTDIITCAVLDKISVTSYSSPDIVEVQGVNNLLDATALEKYFQRQVVNQLMLTGTHIHDPERVDIRGSLTTGDRVSIDVNTIFEGEVVLGDGVTIGANCVIKDTSIGSNTNIQPCSVIESSSIGEECNVGPFAHIRKGTRLDNNVKIGNFVETKNSTLGHESKASHLSYLGDAEIGTKVNIGAGTITCNYDGENKYKTIIGDKSFIGSNTSLVAPIKLGAQSKIGAGSVIYREVPENTLAVSRSIQKNFDNKLINKHIKNNNIKNNNIK